MRSLGTIRARVERLASTSLSLPTTMFVCSEEWYRQCPACAFDLDAHAREAALTEAVARRRPAGPSPSLVCYSTTDMLTCPQCGARLP